MAAYILPFLFLLVFYFPVALSFSSFTSTQTVGASQTSSVTLDVCTQSEDDRPTLDHGLRSVAYFPNWAIYDRKYNPQDLPVEKLTHVLYAFANIRQDTGEVYLSDPWADTGIEPGDPSPDVDGCVKQLFLLKKRNRNLKVLLSIGGYTYSQAGNFVQPACSDEGRKKFAETATALVLNLGFDGIDIDWEYPKDDNEAKAFVALLKTVREYLDKAGGQKRHFLLTAAVPAGPENYQKLRLEEMTPYLDFYNLMAFDYVIDTSTYAGHQANLGPSQKNLKSTPFSSSAALDYYIHTGNVPPSKIVLGIPLYGHSFANTDGPGATFQGTGEGSWEPGIWDFKALPLPGSTELMESISDEGGAGASWSYDESKRLMITYDSGKMVQEKTQFIIDSGLGGAMFWEASGDRGGKDATMEVGSLIATFVEGITSTKGLEQVDNVLEYPESIYDNLQAGFPNE